MKRLTASAVAVLVSLVVVTTGAGAAAAVLSSPAVGGGSTPGFVRPGGWGAVPAVERARIASVLGHVKPAYRLRRSAGVDSYVGLARLDGFSGPVAVSADGSTIAVGSENTSVGPNQYAGAVFVFSRPQGGWAAGASPPVELTASDATEATTLGLSVAMSADGSTIVAGGRFGDFAHGLPQGEVYEFTRPPGGWANGTETARLRASNGAPNDDLGKAVAVSSDGLLVVAAAPSATVGGHLFQGAVYLFRRQQAGWVTGTESAKLTASDGVTHDGLGGSVAVSDDGSTVVAGAPDYGNSGNSVYVFTKPPNGWASGTEVAKLTADGSSCLGNALAVSADASTIAAGADCTDVVGGSRFQGAVYMFTEPQAGWVSEQSTARLTTAGLSYAETYFGMSVAISADGSKVAAGYPYWPCLCTAIGRIYLFTKPESGWGTQAGAAFIGAPPGEPSISFGAFLAMTPDASTIVASNGGAMDVLGHLLSGDPFAPASIVSAPGDGGVYSVGQDVSTRFSCAEGEGGPGLSSCVDSNGVAAMNGQETVGQLDTSTTGQHFYTVTATSQDNQTDVTKIAYTVEPLFQASVNGYGYYPAVNPNRPIAGSTGNEIDFRFTAPAVNFANGSFSIVVPQSWSPPQTSDPNAPGYVTVSQCPSSYTLSTANVVGGRLITLSGLTFAVADHCDVTYANATAPADAGFPGYNFGAEYRVGNGPPASLTPTPQILNAPALAASLKVTGLAQQAAGSSQQITITAYDAYGNEASSGPDVYTGDKSLTFSGAGTAPDGTAPTVTAANPSPLPFGAATVVNFQDGVAHATITLYKAEQASVWATDNAITAPSAVALSVTVAAGDATRLAPPSSTAHLASGTKRTLTSYIGDTYLNPVTGSATVKFTQTAGSGTVTGLASSPTKNGAATDVVTGRLAGPITIQASALGLLPASSSFAITPGAPAKLVFTSPTSPLKVQTARTLNVRVQDAAGNLVTTPVYVSFKQLSGTGKAKLQLSGSSSVNGIASDEVTPTRSGTITIEARTKNGARGTTKFQATP